jgi:hypothetical protein
VKHCLEQVLALVVKHGLNLPRARRRTDIDAVDKFDEIA